jgi:hypothetical protein
MPVHFGDLIGGRPVPWRPADCVRDSTEACLLYPGFGHGEHAMTQHQWVWGTLAVLVLSTSGLIAQDADLQNVESLRKQKQFDKALESLTSMEAQTKLPADTKTVIPFEKALTLIALSKTQSRSDLALGSLNQAQALLEQFLKVEGGHPKAAAASFELGMIWKTRGVNSLQQARLPDNASKRNDLIKHAKAELEQAVSMLSTAAAKFSKTYESFGAYVDRQKEPQKYEQWLAIERLMFQAKLERAIVGFEQASTFDQDDPQRQASLTATADRFEDLHSRYRNQIIGVIARVYQGKCFQEQGERQKALGIYEEVLSNKGDTEFMRNLQAQTMHFKLLCLSSAPTPDYQLIDQLAKKWSSENPDLANRNNGKRILLEQARALEAMSKDKAASLTDQERMSLLKSALAIVQPLAAQPGELRSPAQAMDVRLSSAINGLKPKECDTASGMAPEMAQSLEAKDDPRLILGMTYFQRKEYQKAAEEFEKIPPDSAKYLDAQVQLGQALVVVVADLLEHQEIELPAPEGVYPGPAKIAAFEKKAREVLRKAIATVESELKSDVPPPVNLITAKLSMAHLANLTNESAEAIKLLETDQRSVIKAIALPGGQARTATGIFSLSFASDVYKQLIRAEIGLGDLPGACRAIVELEKLSDDQGKDLPSTFVNYRKYFKPELDRLSQSNSQQCRQSLKRFEDYLSEKLAQKTGQTFDSLAWVGNVSSSLSDSISDWVKSSVFMGIGSQAYRVLLSKCIEEPGFCTKQQERWCKMQLVRCQRQRGEFEAAVKLLAELLKERPDAVDAQTESAMLYQAWGGTDTTFESDQKCSIAMLGDRAFAKNHAPMGMWGWLDLYDKVVKLPNAAEYQKELLEARYNIALYQLKTGLGQFGSKQNATFERAYQDVLATAKKYVLSPQEYQRFNLLFRRISLGTFRTVEDLPRNPNIPPPTPVDKSPDVRPETVE